MNVRNYFFIITALLCGGDIHAMEYEHLIMDRIKALDAAVYEKLTTYKEQFHENAFKKAVDEIPTVLIPRETSHGYPLMILPNEPSDEELERFITSYKVLFDAKKTDPHFYEEEQPSDSDDEDFFYGDEYDSLMTLISHINPLAYQRLIKQERDFCDSALFKTADEGRVLAPTEKEDFYPELYLKSIQSLPEEEQIEYITPLLDDYTTAYETYLSRFHFSQPDYDDYMKLIKQHNPAAYKGLRECKLLLQEPCLQKSTKTKIIPGSRSTFGYPIIKINPTEPFDLIALTKHYKQTSLLTDQERAKKILSIIFLLSPELHKEIIAVDPTGIDHSDYDGNPLNAHCSISSKDGLPYISLSDDIFDLPHKEQEALIAHELGHYFLGHDTIPETTHKTMQGSGYTAAQEYIPEKKVSGQLPFSETFHNAYSRIQENEADEFAVLKLGASIDASKSFLNRTAHLIKKSEDPEKATFTTTHPTNETRLQNLENLRPLVELQNARNALLNSLDVKEMIKEYKQKKY